MTEIPSVRMLEGGARDALAQYTDPSGPFAWWTYDRLGDPHELTPLDCLAPALLDARLDRKTVVAMFANADTPEKRLLNKLQQVLDHPDSTTAHFEDLDLGDAANAWGAVNAALRASNYVASVKTTKVTKVLHRKRPALVPIFDSKVAAFYGCTRRKPSCFWPIIRGDLRETKELLDDVRSIHTTFDGRPMARLRALDIIVWMHQTQRQRGA